MSRHHAPNDFDLLCRSLRDSRKPDVALGLLLAAELLDELPGIPADYLRVLRIAITDAATAVYDHAGDLLAELVTNPAGDPTHQGTP